MHMPGTDPREMQAKAEYADVVLDVARFLRDRVATLEALGVARGRIAIDPGIGFGKTMAHNLALIEALPILAGIGCPIMLGTGFERGLHGRGMACVYADRRRLGQFPHHGNDSGDFGFR
ncbi:MAG: dihydropteroate synthase [Alphaproteobacteria bacterium]